MRYGAPFSLFDEGIVIQGKLKEDSKWRQDIKENMWKNGVDWELRQWVLPKICYVWKLDI